LPEVRTLDVDMGPWFSYSPTDINAFLGSSTIAGLAFRILITNSFHEDFSQGGVFENLTGKAKG
jgi:hypothetical protein